MRSVVCAAIAIIQRPLMKRIDGSSNGVRTFLIRFRPRDRIFSLLMPESEPILSILFVDSASRLKCNGNG
jgi:hypothetical protein